MTAISAPYSSFKRKATSRAVLSSGFIMEGTPSLLRVLVLGSIFMSVVSGTCFMQTKILISAYLLFFEQRA